MTPNIPRLAARLAAARLDAVIGSSPENVTYLAGFWSMSQWARRGPQVFVLFEAGADRPSTLVAEAGALDLVADQDVRVPDIRAVGNFVMTVEPGATLDPVDARQAELFAAPRHGSTLGALIEAIEDRGLAAARLGLDEMGVRPADMAQLKERFPKAEFVEAAGLLADVRAVKTEAEVEILRHAARAAEAGIDAALAIAAEGVTEIEMRRAFNGALVAHDALPAVCCVGFGTRSAMINAQPSDRALRRGEIIRFDVGARYRHYRSDISRIGFYGDPPERLRRMHEAVRLGVVRGHEIMRPGLPVRELYEEVVAAVRQAGLEDFGRSHVGHGIGLDAYDPPSIAPSSDVVLEQNMVLCLETPYYRLGYAGVQVEDMVRITADGVESLMSDDGRLRIVG
jgi:Xaa-Pro aminopeptidase